MAGYLPDEATAAAFADGWYRTGDVGWLEPEGWVHSTDRCKEMIKVSGFQVAPAEIEAVLHGHTAVIDCAVFGVPDERAGEVPVAAVQLQAGSAVTPEDLERLVADTLATYKRVHHVVVVETVPRTPSGKVLRRTLRDEWVSACRRRAARLMDVRLSPEQVALRDAAAQVVDRLGVHGVAELDDRERADEAGRRGRGVRLARAPVGHGRRSDALGVGGRGRRRRRGARAGPGRCRLFSVRPWRPSCAAWPGRRPPPNRRRSPCARTLASSPMVAGDGCQPSALAPDASVASSALVLVDGARRLHPRRRRAGDGCRHRRRPDAARRPHACVGNSDRRRRADADRSVPTSWRRGAVSAWPPPARTSSA